MKKMIEINPSSVKQMLLLENRLSLVEGIKHHWFLNVKNKIKQMKIERKKKVELPSLRTIIELREQSELDIKL